MGWKYCFFNLDFADVGKGTTNESLPTSRVNMSTMILLSPYLKEWSTMASVFTNTRAKLHKKH